MREASGAGLPGSRRLRTALAVAVALIAIGVGLSGPLQVTNPVDVRAFYCAGDVANGGGDPYRVEPLRSCEHRVARAAGQVMLGGVAVPAPLPGYDIAVFRLLARLPFGIVNASLTLATLLSVALATVALARMTGLRPALGFTLLVLGAGYLSLLTGQIAAVSIAGGIGAAFAIAYGRPRLAALGIGVACLEPHLGLPLVIGCGIALPALRRPLAIALGVLAVLTLVALSPEQNLSYATSVLPTHVRSEYGSPLQYSLAGILGMAGVPPSVGIPIANLQYALTVAAAIVVSLRLRSGARDPIVALGPLAAAALGGPFIHLTQIAAAVPLLVLLARRATAVPVRTLCATGLALIAMPWAMIDENATPWFVAATFGALIAVVAGLAARCGRVAIGALAATNIAIGTGISLAVPTRHDDVAMMTRVLSTFDPGAIAEANWQAFVSMTGGDPGHALLFAHLPTYAGLLCGIVAFALVRRTALSPATVSPAAGSPAAVTPAS